MATQTRVALNWSKCAWLQKITLSFFIIARILSTAMCWVYGREWGGTDKTSSFHRPPMLLQIWPWPSSRFGCLGHWEHDLELSNGSSCFMSCLALVRLFRVDNTKQPSYSLLCGFTFLISFIYLRSLCSKNASWNNLVKSTHKLKFFPLNRVCDIIWYCSVLAISSPLEMWMIFCPADPRCVCYSLLGHSAAISVTYRVPHIRLILM